jgi:hypothetical protein
VKNKRESQRAWVAANREHVRAYNREYQRAWRASNPDRERARVQTWRAANPEKIRESTRAAQMKRTFGVSREEYLSTLAAQGGRCAICRTDVPGGQGRFHIDHSHDFGARDRRGHRGLLCHGCNTALGLMKDDPALLLAAATYLADWNAREANTAATVAA